MAYFDDILFVNADAAPQCDAVIDTAFEDLYSLQFIVGESIYYGIDGGSRIELGPGSAFWHHCDHSYQYGPASGSSWHHLWVSFRGARGRALMEEGFMPLSAAGWMPVSERESFRERFERLVGIVQEDLPRRKLEGLLLLEELLLMLMGERRPAHSPAMHEPGIDALLFRMEEAPMADYDFFEEARGLHLSASHFRRLFRRYTGAAPHDFLLHCRMRHAARLLRESQGQVKAIAREVGYEDPAQFSRMFRRKIGLSPQQFRLSIPSRG
ncbi:MAG: AraC family transcriptional regulator [Candidatus Sumerlaeia bacterium]